MRIAALGSLQGRHGMSRRVPRLALGAVSASEADQALGLLEKVQAALEGAYESISDAERRGYPSDVIAGLRTKHTVLEGRYDALAMRYADLNSGAQLDRWFEDALLLEADVTGLEQTTVREVRGNATKRNVTIVAATAAALLIVGGGFYWLYRTGGR
jgi:hypothetical protein